MSGDDLYLDDYDADWPPYNALDDLAERTCHSPVLISYVELLDWDSDDYVDSEDEYDDFSPLSRHKKHEILSQVSKSKKKAPPLFQRQQAQSRPVRQPVLWKSVRERLKSPERPLWIDRQYPEVALLKDWRKRLDASLQRSPPSKPTFSQPKTQLQKEDDSQDFEDMELEAPDTPAELPPVALVEEAAPPAKRKGARTFMNRTSSSLAKQAMHQAHSSNENGTLRKAKRKAMELEGGQALESKTTTKRKQERQSNHNDANVMVDGLTATQGRRDMNGDKAPSQKKAARGCPKGTSNVSKSQPATLASTRSTRNKES